jgi:hypothetical protein
MSQPENITAISLDEIPQLIGRYRQQQVRQASDRELDFLGRKHDICGIKIRAMTVLDFCILTHKQSPLLCRTNPSVAELWLFLWVLSVGRKSSLWRAWLFGRRFRRIDPEQAAVKCFDYVEQMLADVPAGRDGGEASISFVASWCHAIRSAYRCSKEEVLNMSLPEVFQSLRAMKQAASPGAPEGNRKTDDMVNRILIDLRAGKYTLTDLRDGTAKLDLN